MSSAICNGTNVKYQARIKSYPHARYTLVGKPIKRPKVALRRMAEAFMADRLARKGDVLMLADYYDPVAVYWMESR